MWAENPLGSWFVMVKDVSYTVINTVPEIAIQTGLDWSTVIGFAIAVVVFICGTIVTIWNLKLSMEHQDSALRETIKQQRWGIEETLNHQRRLAKAGAEKDSAQQRLALIRETSAEYMATSLLICHHKKIISGTTEIFNSHVDLANTWVEHLNEVRVRALTLSHLLRLLFSSESARFESLIQLLDQLDHKSEYGTQEEVAELRNGFLRLIQELVEDEWRSVQAMY